MRKNKRPLKLSNGYIYILPAFILMAILRIYPLYRGVVISFFKTNLMNKWKYVGLENYIKVFGDDKFYESILITFKFTILVVAGHFILGFLLAHLLNKKIKGITFFRAILILPWVMPESIIAMIFKWLLNPLYGLVNQTLLNLSLISEPISWLGNGQFAFAAVVFACIWKGFPMIMVMILAGMQSISHDMYEAAYIDGANEWQKFWRITLPSLKGVIFTSLVLDIIWWFKHYTIVWVMTQGGPGTATSLISIDIYKRSFEYLTFGRASAVAIVVFLLIFAIQYILEKGFKVNADDEV